MQYNTALHIRSFVTFAVILLGIPVYNFAFAGRARRR